MKLENQTSAGQLPKEISKNIQEISERIKSLELMVAQVHPEKIYDSYSKVDDLRREMFEIDLLSQNLMEAYRLYAAYAFQAMVVPHPEPPEEVENEES